MPVSFHRNCLFLVFGFLGCNAILDNEQREGEVATGGASASGGKSAGSGGGVTPHGGRGAEAGAGGVAGAGGAAGADGVGGDGGDGGEAGGGALCRVDEERPCSFVDPTLLGNCANGTVTCLDDGTWSECDVSPGEDACLKPGDDADCDGTPNSGCLCVDGDTQPCGAETDLGICAFGTSRCGGQTWGPCEGAITPEPRDCRSAQDNDCDGLPDDTLDDVCQCVPNAEQACTSDLDGIGSCRAGKRTCVPAADISSTEWSECEGVVEPLEQELCNDDEEDEDCDGVVNENPPCACLNGRTRGCGNCTGGTQTCVNGAWGDCAGAPSGAPKVYYKDADGDHYGVKNSTVTSCTGLPEGYSERDDDCCDEDERVHPEATYTAAANGGCDKGGDFNCSGMVEYENTDVWNGCCYDYDLACGGLYPNTGWQNSVPECGEKALMMLGYGCPTQEATQGCQ